MKKINIDRLEENTKVTFVTIDTNFKEKNIERTQIIAICAKKFKLINGKLIFLESFEKLTYPVLNGKKYNNKFHKLKLEDLKKGTSEDIRNIFRTIDNSGIRIKEIETLKLKELSKFVKGTTIVTNSKRFLLDSLFIVKNNKVTKKFKENRIIGILEENRNILKLDRIEKEYNSKFEYKLPSLKEVCQYYSINYEEEKIINCFDKNILLIKIFEKMLNTENKNILKEYLYKNIPVINIKEIENFKEVYLNNEKNLKKYILSNKKMDFFKSIPINMRKKLSEMKISYIQIKQLIFKKNAKSFLKAFTPETVLLCIVLDKICYFVNENGKIIAVTKKDFEYKMTRIFNEKKDLIITRNLKTFLILLFKQKNVEFIPY